MQYGHFDNDRREYVIDRVDLPASWTNYLGTEEMCAVVNHTAGGYLFHKSAEYHRITRFRANAVPMDRPGHYIYLRDDDTGEYWSVSWQPVGKPLDWAKYTCRHGLSYTKYECEYGGIRAVQTLFIPRGEAVEIWDLSLENISGRARSISVFSYAELSFHHIDMDNRNFQMSLYAAGGSYADGIIEQDLFYEENGFQYFAATFPPDSYDTVREAFIGPYRTETDPIGVERGTLSGSTELGGNQCASLHRRFILAPGEVLREAFFLGEGPRAMDSVEEYLYTPWGLMLNAPAYSKPDDDIGFVTRVYKGLKENGSIFSHPNPWAWAAECVLGRGDRAMQFYDALCPYWQNDKIETRKAEPYSYCQFITGRDHKKFGEAHHPFMTGSGGWSYVAATRYMLGIRPEFDGLVIDPCIPGGWDGFTAVRRFRGAVYEIEVRNPAHVCKGVKALYLDGVRVERLPLLAPGTTGRVTAVLG